MDGILLVDKPEEWTSFDVVAKVRGIVRQATGLKRPKVGHTGTLDPAATGLLIICIGKATKRVPELMKQDKTYEVELTLGKTSTTADKEGELTPQIVDHVPDIDEIMSALESFKGEIQQTPPAFSAIKVNGKRAYKLARAGKEVKLEPRTVQIHRLNNISYDFPLLCFTAHVGSGTYIRSLAEDIGKKLGTGAYMSNLRRTCIDEFRLEKAAQITDLNEHNLQKHLA